MEGSVTRSKTGWNKDRDREEDDDNNEFLFSEEPESSTISPTTKR